MTTKPKSRFILPGPADVESLPLDAELLSEVREMFQTIWQETPHEIEIERIQSVLEPPMFLSYEAGASQAKLQTRMSRAPMFHYKMIPTRHETGLVVVNGSISVVWELVVEEGGYITFTPQFERLDEIVSVDFSEIMVEINPNLVVYRNFQSGVVIFVV